MDSSANETLAFPKLNDQTFSSKIAKPLHLICSTIPRPEMAFLISGFVSSRMLWSLCSHLSRTKRAAVTVYSKVFPQVEKHNFRMKTPRTEKVAWNTMQPLQRERRSVKRNLLTINEQHVVENSALTTYFNVIIHLWSDCSVLPSGLYILKVRDSYRTQNHFKLWQNRRKEHQRTIREWRGKEQHLSGWDFL